MKFVKKIYYRVRQTVQFVGDVTCPYFKKDNEKNKNEFKIYRMYLKAYILPVRIKKKL